MADAHTPLWNLQEWKDEAEEWRGTYVDNTAVEILADDFDACFRDGVIAGKAELAEQIVNLRQTIEWERDARQKCEAALRLKDKAMGVLFERLAAAGVDCSDLFS